MKREIYETFLAIASLRSFRKAAERLNTTQSNVSARIAALERQMGGSLFTRGANTVALTPLGRELISPAEHVLHAMEVFSARAKADLTREGTLRLALSENMVTTVLPGFMVAFARFYPKVNVEITVDSTTNQREALIARHIDLAFLMGPVSDYEITNIPLATLPMLWVAAPDHPAAREPSLEPTDLGRWPIISYARNSRPYVQLREALLRHRVPVPTLYASNSLNASRSMVQSRLGVATMPAVFAGPFLESGDIVEIDPKLQLNDLVFTASFPSEPTNSLSRAAAEIAVGSAAQLRD